MSEEVPQGWKKDVLGNLCSSIRGVSYKPEDLRNEKSTQAVTLLRSNNIQEGGIDFNNVQYVDINKVKQKQIMIDGDIAVCMSNGSKRLVGKSAILHNQVISEIFTVGAFCSIIRAKEKSSDQFVRHLLQSDDYKKQVEFSLAGSAINNLKDGDVENYTFLLPPLPEQKKITSILTSVDEVIETTQKQIDKLQNLKKATMNELLTKGIGHTEFKDSGLGRIPKSWEVSRIGLYLNEFGQKSKQNDEYEVFTSSSKGLVKQSDYYGENRLTRRDNIGFNIIPERYITYRSRTDSNKFFFNQNNLNATGLVSKYYPVFTHKKGVELNHFITSLLNFHSQKFANEGVGTSQVVLSFNALKFVKLAMPSLNEQLEIAKIISGVDENLRFMSKKLSQTQSLKKSLMQDLLTGKVRVQVH